MNDAQRILAEMKKTLDEHFGLVRADELKELAHGPIKPEHRVSEAAAAKFARLMKEDEKDLTLEQRVARLERTLGLI